MGLSVVVAPSSLIHLHPLLLRVRVIIESGEERLSLSVYAFLSPLSLAPSCRQHPDSVLNVRGFIQQAFLFSVCYHRSGDSHNPQSPAIAVIIPRFPCLRLSRAGFLNSRQNFPDISPARCTPGHVVYNQFLHPVTSLLSNICIPHGRVGNLSRPLCPPARIPSRQSRHKQDKPGCRQPC